MKGLGKVRRKQLSLTCIGQLVKFESFTAPYVHSNIVESKELLKMLAFRWRVCHVISTRVARGKIGIWVVKTFLTPFFR